MIVDRSCYVYFRASSYSMRSHLVYRNNSCALTQLI